MKKIIFAGILVISAASASPSKPSSMWERSDAIKRCDFDQLELKDWWPSTVPQDARTVPEEKINRAMILLGHVSYPTDADLAKIHKLIVSDFPNTISEYRQVLPSDCPLLRMNLGKALINTAKINPAHRDLIATNLKKVLLAPKYQNFMEAMIDATLLDYGAKHGLWKVPAKTQSALTSLQAHLQNSAKSWQEKMTNPKLTPDAEVAAAQEQNVTAKYFAQIRQVTAQLN